MLPPDAPPSPSRVRRRLLYALLALAVLLALVFTPPLVSVDRYRHRIAQTMSDSLGRPVHIDDVKLHLLPLPSLELRNVVVSEDPAFGAEPTIRANRVLAILRPSSLWRRPVEFSTIRFAADESGAGPSVNLVRNAAGRWNLDSVLMQAAHVPTAPTSQRKAGPAPRFPYIEAAAARVNLKLGQEKMPFSLTDADFALWQPSPGQWHVRLDGHPIRTDVPVSETGVVRLEGTLAHAASMAQIPVDLQATWTGAQLGEATVLVTGQDMGWRGTGTLHATLRGPLADARLASTLELQSLRRADFIPPRTLDLTITCQAHATVTEATLEDPRCSLPAPLPESRTGAPGSAGAVQLEATRFDLTGRSATGLRFGIHASSAWLLDWARLLSPTIPAEESPLGEVEGSLAQVVAGSGGGTFWSGTLHGSLTGIPPWHTPGAIPSTYEFTVIGSPSGLDLAPVNLAAGSEPALALSGNFSAAGYSLRLLGAASPGHVRELAARLPPFGAGFTPVSGPAPAGPHTTSDPSQRLDLTCTRPWSAAEETCTSGRLPEARTPARARSRPKRRR